jgi:hypothetical protein
MGMLYRIAQVNSICLMFTTAAIIVAKNSFNSLINKERGQNQVQRNH